MVHGQNRRIRRHDGESVNDPLLASSFDDDDDEDDDELNCYDSEGDSKAEVDVDSCGASTLTTADKLIPTCSNGFHAKSTDPIISVKNTRIHVNPHNETEPVTSRACDINANVSTCPPAPHLLAPILDVLPPDSAPQSSSSQSQQAPSGSLAIQPGQQSNRYLPTTTSTLPMLLPSSQYHQLQQHLGQLSPFASSRVVHGCSFRLGYHGSSEIDELQPDSSMAPPACWKYRTKKSMVEEAVLKLKVGRWRSSKNDKTKNFPRNNFKIETTFLR